IHAGCIGGTVLAPGLDPGQLARCGSFLAQVGVLTAGCAEYRADSSLNERAEKVLAHRGDRPGSGAGGRLDFRGDGHAQSPSRVIRGYAFDARCEAAGCNRSPALRYPLQAAHWGAAVSVVLRSYLAEWPVRRLASSARVRIPSLR